MGALLCTLVGCGDDAAVPDGSMPMPDDRRSPPGASGAIDQGESLPDVTNDIDGEPRVATPDLGADER